MKRSLWLKALRRGIRKNSPKYKGGKITSQGYVKILIGQYKNGHSKYELEHRLVMQKIIKRRLNDGEIVHHINEVTTDNRPENLMLFPNVTAHRTYHRMLCKNTNSEFLFGREFKKGRYLEKITRKDGK